MYSSITIVGRTGRDPEARVMPNGDTVTAFSVATDHQYTDRNGQKVKSTTWFKVAVFGKQAESVNEFLSKGKMVLVEGTLRADAKTGGPTLFKRQDGSTGAAFEINARTVRFLSPKEEAAASSDDDSSSPF